MSIRPLILLTNDDGIHSRGLRAAVAVCASLGELLVVAPARQQTASGRSKPGTSTGRIEQVTFWVDGVAIIGLGIDGSPAQAVEHGLFEFALRPVALAVSGINFGAMVLKHGLPPGVDVLKLDVPEGATTATPWRWTRVSRQRYFYPVAPRRTSLEHAVPMGFIRRADPATVEPDSDIRAVAIDGVVSLCPLSNDLTARTPVGELAAWGGAMEAWYPWA